MALLVVEDNHQVRDAWVRHTRRAFHVLACSTVKQARQAIESCDHLEGLVVDLGLPDGSGLDVLADLPDRDTPTLLVSARQRPRGLASSIQFLEKPFRSDRLDEFLIAVACRQEPSVSLRAAIFDVCVRWRLSVAEAQVVVAFMRRGTRHDVAALLEVSPDTVKSRVAEILRKSGHKTIIDIHHAILEVFRVHSTV